MVPKIVLVLCLSTKTFALRVGVSCLTNDRRRSSLAKRGEIGKKGAEYFYKCIAKSSLSQNFGCVLKLPENAILLLQIPFTENILL